jgi:hypothetical protein
MAKTHLLATAALALLAIAGSPRAEGLVEDAARPLLTGTAAQAGLLRQALEGGEIAPGATLERALVPFEQSLETYTFRGEDDVATFTFELAGAEAAAGGALHLAYINAVSVLPDTAKLDVSVNGRNVGGFAITSPSGVRTEKIALGPDALRPGRNVVRLRARQHHRVDCSLEATHELWTKLDPALSGFASAAKVAFDDFDSLLAIRRNADDRTDVRVVISGALSAEALNEAAAALQPFVLFLNRDDVTVTMADEPGSGPGIDLVMVMDRNATTVLQRLALADVARGFSVRAGVTKDRASLVLRAGDRREIEAAVLAAATGPMADGLKSGLLAAGRGTIAVDAGDRRTLRDAGYETRVFSGRLSRTRFSLEMPADFYPADYATLDLRLHAATSPGLGDGAQLLVRVNDRVVKSYPFRDRSGEQLEGKRIELPLRAFRPGVNQVELLAELPMPADAACRPEERDDGKPRFILLDKTEIEVPALARIARLPDLAAFAGKAYPYGGGKPFDLVIDRADNQSASAALTLLARLALSARAPLPAEITLGAPIAQTGRDALVVASQADFVELGAAGKAAFPREGDIGTSIADLMKPDPVVTAPVQDAAAPAAGGTDDLLRAFSNSTAPKTDDLPFTARAALWLDAATLSFKRWLSYEGDAAESAPPAGSEALVTLSQQRSPDGRATWTTVRAHAPRDVEAGVRRLVDPAIWRDLEGGTATIEAASLSMISTPATERYVEGLNDRSPGNLRRLAAAWFSDNFQVYVLLVLACLGFFAVWLGLIVPSKGVRTDR